ncbi:sickle tail protein homolog isoform X4 [Polypterus senegalus]|uniref:sickle tail protein homolog isoform X4 n=1 Tax=Polypterus senegalus TaxID=55291 RepID=UPI001964746D|nr:sickle tail protein homolog isoform X4 [Polypterus senegalus]
MSKPTRLARPSSAGAASKLPSARKEDLGSRTKAISLGEKLLRTGSEGNLVKQPHKQQVQAAEQTAVSKRTSVPKEPAKSNLRVTSAEDADHLLKKQGVANGSSRTSNARAARHIPRRHTVGGPRSSKEILGMQPSEMDRKREAFLEHLKQKYPHHASAIMGHQERLREQTFAQMLASLRTELDIQGFLLKILAPFRSRSPKHKETHGEPAEPVSAETPEAMSEGDAPGPFTRGSRSRASLPVVRSTNLTKDRSLGVLYLQYADETKQIRMPNEITSADTVRALFVSAFPQQLTMKMMESPNVAVYIKDDLRNMYYELSDVRSITDQSCLKVYHKDPAHAFSYNHRPGDGDLRMHRESFSPREAPYPLRQTQGQPPLHGVQSSLPHPVAHSMPPSPSRIQYGAPRAMVMPGSATIPRVPQGRSVSPSPSAILERRDVKPDEDMSNKAVALLRNDSLYADPYLLQEARLSIASSHSCHPGDVPDHVMGYHRGSVRSTGSYSSSTMTTEMMEHHAVYRQKSRKYSDSHLPTLGTKTPPASPHRMTDMRVVEMHAGQNAHVVPTSPPPPPPPHGVQLDRSSPIRQSFKKEQGGAMEVMKTRSNMASPALPDNMAMQVDKQLMGQGPAASSNDPQTREKAAKPVTQAVSANGGGFASGEAASLTTVKSSMTSTESVTTVILPPAGGPTAVQVNAFDFRKNISDLRLQLQQMRQLQMQNQETLSLMLKKAEAEINSKVTEVVKRLEDPVQRQRMLVEEDRQKYLAEEEKIIQQLCELEKYVDDLKKDSTTVHKAVTLKDVEDGAVSLRKVGESLASLKGEFPALQNRMRGVLRVEVDAVKFLKEEPHKLDCMLKRVKTLTEILTELRRCSTENLLKGSEPTQVLTTTSTTTVLAESFVNFPDSDPAGSKYLQVKEQVAFIQPQPQSSSSTITPEPQTSSVKTEVMPSSPMVIHHVQSSPVFVHQSQHSEALVLPSPSPPAAPAQCPDFSMLLQNQQYVETNTVMQQKHQQNSDPASLTPQGMNSNGSAMQSLFIEEIHTSRSKSRNRVMSIEAAEKEWEEKRQNMGQYDGKEFEKLLQEAQANMMKGIPSLEVMAGASVQPPPQIPASNNGDVTDKKEEFPASEDVPLAAPVEEKATKCPPPPPPRRSYPPGSGLTTGRSGEVIFTAKKESVTIQKETQEEVANVQSSQTSCETKATQHVAPRVMASALQEEEDDDGDKIMAELQVFQKCTFMDVGTKSIVEHPRVETQVKEIRPSALMSPKEKKQSVEIPEDKQRLDIDGNELLRDSPGVIYYVTAQLSPDYAAQYAEEQKKQQEFFPQVSATASQISQVTDYETSQTAEKFVAKKSVEPSECAYVERQVSNPNKSPPAQHFSDRTSHNVVHAESEDEAHSEIRNKVTETVIQIVSCSPSLTTVGTSEAVSQEERLSSTNLQNSASMSEEGPDRAKAHEEWVETTKSQVVLRTKAPKIRVKYAEEVNSSSSSPTEEIPSPSDNIAFMITNTQVQALSCGEVQEIVSNQGEEVQTVNVDSNREVTSQNYSQDHLGNEQPVVSLDKKPVIIIFDEPMDIKSAYKRLSTIFECEEELERLMAEERIDEEPEETDPAAKTATPRDPKGSVSPVWKSNDSLTLSETGQYYTSNLPIYGEVLAAESKFDASEANKHDAKKKFKFKSPKKQLAAITQAIRTGMKTGKKTLQVVVYEDEEELDGTVKQHKEAKRFEISRSKTKDEDDVSETSAQLTSVDSQCRTNEIRKNAYKTLDSLEQTIKQLETTISEMSPKAREEHGMEEECKTYFVATPEYVEKTTEESDDFHSALSETPAAFLYKTHTKKSKQQVQLRSAANTTTTTTSNSEQATSVISPSSRMPVPVSSKSRSQQGVSDKSGKQQKLQDPQRQFRQANGSAKKAGGDSKSASPALPASKIPAFSPSSGKTSSVPAFSSDGANPTNSSPRSSIPSPNLLNPQASRSSSCPSAPSKHIPSLSNGSLKLQSPTLSGKGQSLSFSAQTPNGRPSPSSPSSSSSSSSSSPSPISPTSLSQGGKTIRTIHTPSFISYRAQNGNSKPLPSPAKDVV